MRKLFFTFVFAATLLCHTQSAYSENKNTNPKSKVHAPVIISGGQNKEGYTINFENVSMLEFMKFISKIANVNFVYEPEDVNFPITVVSDTPAALEDVMAAFVQVLRINDLNLIEDGNNYVLNKNDTVKQIPTIVSDADPFEGNYFPGYVTRVFHLVNANPSRIAQLITPMMSTDAIIEVMESSRLIIVTDITANINQVSKLLTILDKPQSALQIGSFVVKNNNIDSLKTLAEQLILPIAGEQTVVLVPQPTTSTLFIVSTPFMINQVQSILTELDGSPIIGQQKELSANNIFIYKIKYRTPEFVENSLSNIAKNAQDLGFASNGIYETIANMKFLKSTNSLLFIGPSSAIDRIKELLTQIDIPGKPFANNEHAHFYMFHPEFATPKEIKNILVDIAKNMDASGLADQALISAIENSRIIDATNSILFTGDNETIDQIKTILNQIDQESGEFRIHSSSFFIYKLKNASHQQIEQSLQTFVDKLENSRMPNSALIQAIKSMKWIEQTNSIIFTGSEKSLSEISTILPQFDVEASGSSMHEFYMYNPKHLTPDELLDSIHELAKRLENSGLSDPSFIATLSNAKYVPSSKAIVFTGNSQTIDKIKSLMVTLDIPEEMAQKKQIFIYKPKYVSKEILEESLDHFASTLPDSSSTKETIDNAEWIESSHSFVFQGEPKSIEEIKQIIAVTDTQETEEAKQEIFVYKPVYASKDLIESALDNFKESLSKTSPTRQTINNARWIESSKSFVFKGNEKAIDEIKQILAVTDVDQFSKENKTYYIYKLKYIPGDLVIGDLKRMVRNLQASTKEKQGLIDTVENIEWVKSTNSLFITGTRNDVDQVKALIAEFDQADEDKKPIEPTTSFLIYKPVYATPQELEVALRNLGEDLEDSGLTDTSLLNTIDGVKLSSSTNALVFTGTQTNLDKIKDLLKTIDVPKDKDTSIQKVGLSTFLIYKIKEASPQYLMNAVRQLGNDMRNSKGSDKEFVRAIESMRFVQETDSLIFTGTEPALEKIKKLLERLDIGDETAKKPVERPGGYIIYKPKYVPGPELINILKDFEQNLRVSGIDDASLFDVINNLKWMEKTESIIISGNEKDTAKVKELLEKFDNPMKGSQKPMSIETIEDVSFLMYKLQYHQGDEIEVALKQIATDLKRNKDSQDSDKLINAIQSIQWIKVTNSLIGSGEPRTLEKLRELLFSIDIPLTQVFIEVLVLKTTLGKRLDFGLQWGSQGSYRNRFGYGFGNFPPTSIDNGTFGTNLQNISATTTPKGSDIPFVSGGDLGIIGDIILHKGQTYLALGSLVNALEQDGDTTIVINQKIVAQDNKLAELFVGSNIPFNGSTVQILGQTQTTSSNLEYRDIGTSLKLLPTIGDNNIVTLDIDLEISSSNQQGGTNDDFSGSTVQSNQLSALITDKTTMKTRLHVPDNHFLAISGQIRDQTVHDRAGVPCLGGLPIIGAAFSNNQSTKEYGNVIMFIRPKVITSNEIWKIITDRQEEIHRSQAEPEAFDAGIELVASPDDE